MLKVHMEKNLFPEKTKQGVEEQLLRDYYTRRTAVVSRGNRCLCRRLPFQYGEYTPGTESIYLYPTGLINIAKGVTR